MKLLTGLFRFARKRTQTTDNDMGMFRDKLSELVEKKDALSDEEISAKVDELKAMTADLPDEEEKGKLDRFLEDFKSVKEQDEATAKEAASMVADLFEKLDTEAMKDVPAVEEETTEEVVEEPTDGADKVEESEEVKEELSDADGAEEVAEEAVEETTAEDGNADYTLEEIYQFIKKRMAEDSACEDSGEEVDEEEQEEKEEVVTDHAPHIPVTMNGSKVADGSLASMFAKLKEGGR